jgi:hypothetical protein
MWLACVEAEGPTHDKRTFECRVCADSDEAGHAFQSEAGRYSELMPARYSDAKPATWCIARVGRLV